MQANPTIDQLAVNTIRSLSMDAVEKANSGHPGMPMGMADVAYVLWTRFLRHNPANRTWANRDRFVLSAGHGSMLLYSLLHLSGYEVSLEDLKAFRQLGSITPGHPEVGMTVGVETTTGPLGQGFATGVGMAMAEAHLASLFNGPSSPLVDHHTYAIVSDGDLMEGVSHEAASLAGHLKLGKIIYLYDSNRISIDGSTDLTFTDDTAMRFRSYGWHVTTCDGHDREAIEKAIREAQAVKDQPSLVICRTHIGFGSPNKQDSESSHGAPLGKEEVRATKAALGLDPDRQFHVPEEVYRHMDARQAGAVREGEWRSLLEASSAERPDLTMEFKRRLSGELPPRWADALPVFPESPSGMASRKASGSVIQALVGVLPELVGGSADLAGSNNTWMKDAGVLDRDERSGRNVHYGVREHAMGAAMNGMALHGGVIPFAGTFLVFADYCRPAIRLAALSHLQVIYVFTHDSIGLGEDGPTHQPIEHLASLRAMPNVQVLRPADANEVAACWRLALEHRTGPSVLVLTRQNLPTLPDGESRQRMTARGAYVANGVEPGSADAVLISTGSEVAACLEASKILSAGGHQVSVVSMPSWEVFARQDSDWREQVLPSSQTRRISVEAATTFGWPAWTGSEGLNIGIDRFGASAPAEALFDLFGLTPDQIAASVVDHLKRA